MESRLCLTLLFLLFTAVMCQKGAPRLNCNEEIVRGSKKIFPAAIYNNFLEDNKNSGKGFVYSDVNLFRTLMLLFHATDMGVQKTISGFYGMLENFSCNENWCKLIKDVLQPLIGKGNVLFSNLFFDNYKKLKGTRNYAYDSLSSCLGKDLYLTYFGSQRTSAIAKINEIYEAKTGRSGHFTGSLHQDTDFYLQVGMKLQPEIYNSYVPITNKERNFTDLDGNEHVIDWIGIEGIHNSISQKLDGCRNEIIFTTAFVYKGDYWLLMFQPKFDASDNLYTKINCLKAIFPKMKDYIELGKKIHLGDNMGTKQIYQLAVPPIDIQTLADYKPLLENDLPELFKRGKMMNVYADVEDTLHELKIYEEFSIKRPSYKPINSTVQTFVDSPFAFAFVNTQTDFILKRGAYLRV